MTLSLCYGDGLTGGTKHHVMSSCLGHVGMCMHHSDFIRETKTIGSSKRPSMSPLCRKEFDSRYILDPNEIGPLELLLCRRTDTRGRGGKVPYVPRTSL
jgi:hypothetical protein